MPAPTVIVVSRTILPCAKADNTRSAGHGALQHMWEPALPAMRRAGGARSREHHNPLDLYPQGHRNSELNKMDIITAITPVAPVTEAPASTADSPSTDFSAALQQAQSTAAEPTAPAAIAPRPETPKVVASTPPLPAEQSEIPVALQPAVQQPEPEPEQPPAPVAPKVAETEPAEDEPVPMAPDPLASLATPESDTPDDTEETTSQSEDPLDAIRQRLNLIDSAGQLAYGALAITPPTAWPQTPQATPEQAPDLDHGTEIRLAETPQWSPPETDSFTLEPGEPAATPIATALVAESETDTTDTALPDRKPATTSDTPTPSLNGISSLVSSNGATVSPPTSATPQPAAPLGSDTWQADLGQQVLAMVQRGDQQVDMQLNPADLGPLSISLNVSESGIQAQFQSVHAAVRSAVEQALPQLQSTLAAQGLTLGQASVNDGASRQAGGEQPHRDPAGSGGEAPSERAQKTPAALPAQRIATAGAGVDLYL